MCVAILAHEACTQTQICACSTVLVNTRSPGGLAYPPDFKHQDGHKISRESAFKKKSVCRCLPRCRAERSAHVCLPEPSSVCRGVAEDLFIDELWCARPVCLEGSKLECSLARYKFGYENRRCYMTCPRSARCHQCPSRSRKSQKHCAIWLKGDCSREAQNSQVCHHWDSPM